MNNIHLRAAAEHNEKAQQYCLMADRIMLGNGGLTLKAVGNCTELSVDLSKLIHAELAELLCTYADHHMDAAAREAAGVVGSGVDDEE